MSDYDSDISTIALNKPKRILADDINLEVKMIAFWQFGICHVYNIWNDKPNLKNIEA